VRCNDSLYQGGRGFEDPAVNLCPPRDWQAFERLARDLVGRVLGDVHADLNGRSGQAQAGIDILATDRKSGAAVGVQCRRRGDTSDAWRRVPTEAELREEIGKARTYRGKLNRFVLLTSGPNDVRLKQVAAELTEQHRTEGRFEVLVHAWDWIEAQLAQHPDLAVRHGLVVSISGDATPHSAVARDIGGRLRRAIDLMNEGRADDDRFTLPSLAAYMGQDDWRRLESIADGVSDAGAAELRMVAQALGINPVWLLEGKEAPFRLHRADRTVPVEELHELVLAMQPRAVYFVRCADECFSATLVIERDDVQWFVWTIDFPVSEHVGGTGARQMLEFCALIRRLDVDCEEAMDIGLSGRHLPRADFDALVEGEVYPGRHLRWCCNDGWWEDFGYLSLENVQGDEPHQMQLRRAIEITTHVRNRRRSSNPVHSFLQWGLLATD
jgi:hypothetical protein